MNNKKLGTYFEQEMCSKLSQAGYWVHFISPDVSGKQPFDIIAVKNGKAIALDCKTSSKKTFGIDRLEDNQLMSFDKWMRCGNDNPMLAVKFEDEIFLVDYLTLKLFGKVKLEEKQSGVYSWERYTSAES